MLGPIGQCMCLGTEMPDYIERGYLYKSKLKFVSQCTLVGSCLFFFHWYCHSVCLFFCFFSVSHSELSSAQEAMYIFMSPSFSECSRSLSSFPGVLLTLPKTLWSASLGSPLSASARNLTVLPVFYHSRLWRMQGCKSERRYVSLCFVRIIYFRCESFLKRQLPVYNI